MFHFDAYQAIVIRIHFFIFKTLCSLIYFDIRIMGLLITLVLEMLSVGARLCVREPELIIVIVLFKI